MPPPIKAPKRAWELAKPIEEFWLLEPESKLNSGLSEAEKRALSLLAEHAGAIALEADPKWKEQVDDNFTLADTGAQLRAKLQGQVLAQLQKEELALLGFQLGGAVIDPNAEPVQLDHRIFNEIGGVPGSSSFAAGYLAFQTGRVECAGTQYTNLRVISFDEWEWLETQRSRGGRTRLKDDLAKAALLLARRDTSFPRDSVVQSGAVLREFVRTDEEVLTSFPASLSQSTCERALKIAFPPDGKTRPLNLVTDE